MILVDPFGITGAGPHAANWLDTLDPAFLDVVSLAGGLAEAAMRPKATKAPSRWVEALAKADADIARGDVVPAFVVHEHLRQALAELEAELAGTPAPSQCRSEL